MGRSDSDGDGKVDVEVFVRSHAEVRHQRHYQWVDENVVPSVGRFRVVCTARGGVDRPAPGVGPGPCISEVSGAKEMFKEF